MAESEGEFEIIGRIFAPLAKDTGALGLKDDAAILMVTEAEELVVTCDTLVAGVHFLPDDPPQSVGHKALAVNLSDLTAKGAHGFAYTLALSVPRDISTAWLEDFANGLRGVQEQSGISLVGGDTSASPGPVTITITALGEVVHEPAVMRLGAASGDGLYVSGTIGDAYLGLRLLRDPSLAKTWGLSDEDVAFLVERYRCPRPNTHLAVLVRNFGRAAIDVSDGLIGDIEKLCEASHVGADIDAGRVPLSEAAKRALAQDPSLLEALITAGDDYEVVLAVSEKSAPQFESEAGDKGGRFTRLGTLKQPTEGLVVRDVAGQPLELKHKGFSHF
ncbi:MAG: thiamine-phosphate kinase [Alphaproteobacteria bacterium]